MSLQAGEVKLRVGILPVRAENASELFGLLRIAGRGVCPVGDVSAVAVVTEQDYVAVTAGAAGATQNIIDITVISRVTENHGAGAREIAVQHRIPYAGFRAEREIQQERIAGRQKAKGFDRFLRGHALTAREGGEHDEGIHLQTVLSEHFAAPVDLDQPPHPAVQKQDRHKLRNGVDAVKHALPEDQNVERENDAKQNEHSVKQVVGDVPHVVLVREASAVCHIRGDARVKLIDAGDHAGLIQKAEHDHQKDAHADCVRVVALPEPGDQIDRYDNERGIPYENAVRDNDCGAQAVAKQRITYPQERHEQSAQQNGEQQSGRLQNEENIDAAQSGVNQVADAPAHIDDIDRVEIQKGGQRKSDHEIYRVSRLRQRHFPKPRAQ